jgi:hypothetical protein
VAVEDDNMLARDVKRENWACERSYMPYKALLDRVYSPYFLLHSSNNTQGATRDNKNWNVLPKKGTRGGPGGACLCRRRDHTAHAATNTRTESEGDNPAPELERDTRL